MRYEQFRADLDEQQLDEIKALMNMASWFSKKYQNVLAAGAKKLGQGEIQKFTNQHLRAFMRMMGRYNADWPTVTMFVIYQYLRLMAKLDDNDILDVINTTMKDPKIKIKKPLTMQQIRDQKRETLPSSFSQSGGDPAQMNQLISQMIIAAGAVRQMERHWERQSGASQMPANTYGNATSASGGKTAQSSGSKSAQPSGGAQQTTQQSQVAAINNALAQLGVTP